MENGTAYTIRWTAVAGSSGTTAWDTTRAYGGAQSLKLLTAKTAADYQGALLHLGVPSNNHVVGLYLTWMTNAALADFQDIALKLDYFDGSNEYIAQVRYIGTDGTATEKWQYYDSSGSYANITSGGQKLVNAVESWHWAKLVANFDKGKYRNLFSDDKYFDLSDLSLYSTADTSTKPRLDVQITVADETGSATITAWIDNVIVTVSEDR